MARYVKTEEGYQEIEAIKSKFGPFKPAGKSYLTFSSSSSFTLTVNDATKHWNGTLEYFSSDKTWTVWDGTIALSAVADDGEYVLYLRGTRNTIITGSSSNYRWILTGTDIKCIGNIENLLDYATVQSGVHPTMASNCYRSMFQGCTGLTQAPALLATTLADSCYSGMFYGCTSLTKAPALPATTLANSCYMVMFYGCTSLAQAPALPATTLTNYCYRSMFQGCTGLIQAPALPATTLASNCYNSMFYGCTSLIQAPALPATTLANYCYYCMFQNCTALTQAPVLPATTLASYCYSSMFQGCTGLTQAPALPATTLASGCYMSMFLGCTSLTQAPALPATTLADYCYQSMFTGCTSLTQAPDLPATTLKNECYRSMFQNCPSLKLSSTQTGEYTQEYRIPSSGEGVTVPSALSTMFTFTGGTFTGTPEINTTYYLSSGNMIVRETEIATLNGYVGSMIDVAITEHTSNPLNITGATVGQTVVVKAVDETGKPTEWEAADMASGGGDGSAENWRLVNTVTTAEDVSNIMITQDSDGNPLSLKKVKIFAKVRGNSAGLSTWCRITVNNLTNNFYSDIQNTFAAKEGQDYYNYARADFAIYAGRLMLELLLRSANNAASKNTLWWVSNSGCFENYPDVVDAITSIRVWSASAGIGAGTELMIYGVEA